MSVIIRKASKKHVKIKMGYQGPAGSGKTMSAILTAEGLCGDLSKVVVIDTENKSSELYAHLGGYSVIELPPPFAPERYIERIKAAEEAGFEVIIIDSVSHEWEGKGGVLDISNSMTGNSFTNWAKITPRHNAFVDAILQSPCHVIVTFRTKTDYVLVEKNGKQVPEKVGMKAVTREGWEYDMTIVFDLDIKQNTNVSKDRTGLFTNKPSFIPSAETGKTIKAWCESGEAAGPDPISLAIAEAYAANSTPDLKAVWERYPQYHKDKAFAKAATDRKLALTVKPEDQIHEDNLADHEANGQPNITHNAQ